MLNLIKAVIIMGTATTYLGGVSQAQSPANTGVDVAAKPDISLQAIAKPIMGFSTWTRFGCMPQKKLLPEIKFPTLTFNGSTLTAPLNERDSILLMGSSSTSQYSFQHFMLDQAQSLLDSGLKDAGYTYLNIDDCWQALDRSKAGSPEKFSPALESALKDVAKMKVEKPDFQILQKLKDTLEAELAKKKPTSELALKQMEVLQLNLTKTLEVKDDSLMVFVTATARSLSEGLTGPLKGAPRWEHVTYLYGRDWNQNGFDTDIAKYVNYVHAMGLKVGIYSSKGDEACNDWWPPASGRFEKTDAEAFAGWGIDFLKYDNCKTINSSEEAAAVMAKALKEASNKTGRPIIFLDGTPAYRVSGGEMGNPQYYNSMEFLRNNGVSQLRMGSDIVEYPYRNPAFQNEIPQKMPSPNPWSSITSGCCQSGVYSVFRQGALMGRYTAPGHWNDLDYLMIGDNGLTTDEEQSQMSLWAILGSPLINSSDMRKLRPDYIKKLTKEKYFNTNQTLKSHLENSVRILTQKDAISINQDEMGVGGYIVEETHQEQDKGYVIAARPLNDGSLAVVVLNKGAEPLSMDVSFEKLGYSLSPNIVLSVHEIWQNVKSSESPIKIQGLASHASRMFKISAQTNGKTVRPNPRGLIMNNYSQDFLNNGNKKHNSTLCWQAPKNAKLKDKVTLGYCGDTLPQTWIRDLSTHKIKLADTDLCVSASETSRDITLESCANVATKIQNFIIMSTA